MKYKVDKTFKRYTASLVAKGYIQTYGVDYLKTFALFTKMNTIRSLLSENNNKIYDSSIFEMHFWMKN